MTALRIIAAVALLASATTANAAEFFNVTVERAGVQSSTAALTFRGVETFDGRSGGANQSFTTSFGTGGTITGTYTGVQIDGANAYGSAGGSGNHAVTFSNAGYALDLSTTDARGINYFGLWLSALDAGNTLTFQRAGQTIFTYSAADLTLRLATDPAYAGNPNSGVNKGESYAFLNFTNTGGTFDRVLFNQRLPTGGLESDNHTVGFLAAPTGIAAVPEPATWAMMIGGFGLIGAAMRRRRTATVTYA